MASRRLDISSLLCDDNPPAFSPLEALVHAATEERKRLDATHDQHPRTYHDHRHHHDQHRAQELELRAYDHDRRRRLQEAELQQQQQQQLQQQQQHRLQEQKRAQELEYQEAQYQRQKDIDRALRVQEHERRLREEEERRLMELYDRQQREERHREAERQRLYEQRLIEERILEQRQREEQRELERIRALERDRLLREHAERQQRELIERQREHDRIDELHRHHRPQPIIATPHPPSISHLISHPHHRKSDSLHINHSPPLQPLPAPIPPPSLDDPRPIKKRRYSESPTRPISDDKERIARERDKMLVGELGYGRVDSPTAGPSYPPRRPGSGHGHARKPVAVSDLLVDREPVRPVSREADAHRVVSPLGRRSPPGSQIGRAKAARKSDEFLLREPPPIIAEPEVKKLKEEPKLKQELKPPRPRISSDEIRTPVVEKKLSKDTAPPPPPPPPAPPKTLPSKVQQEDAHEWFLQQFDAEPSPTTSARPEPPHTPSPSLSPVTSTAPAPAPPSAKTPPASLTPIAAAVVTLEQELEELVSEPTATTSASVAVVKKQDPDLDMDLDVDLAVTELVDTLDGESVKREPAGMEVDVEDELLSLVDDRPPPPAPLPAPARRAPGSSASAAVSSSTATSVKPAPLVHRSVSEARQASPPIMSASLGPALAVSSSSAVRQSSTRPTSERGSMPPPASTSVSSAASKKGGERASSVVPPATGPSGKKKKETTAKAASKAKPAAAAGASSTPAPTAKPRAKPAAKGKKGAAAEVATPAPPAPSKAAKALTGRKTAPSVSRSRSASVMPAGSVSVGPESDAVKAEKQEEEEESDAENEDDNKLYCVCKTKYDEDRFMIACDRCDEWYHTQCVRMPDLEVDLVDQFICPLCVEKNPHLNLQTTYKQRCLYGLRHPDPSSTKACHKAARGAFSKYCSDECGVKYMQSRIDTWAKKGGKPDKLWESVKNAEKREGVVVCAVEPETNGCQMEVDTDAKQEQDVKPELVKQRIVPPKKRKVAQETERLNALLDSVMMLREEIRRGMEVVVWRERLLQLASERAESVGQCGWDQRLCLDDEEWVDMGAGVLESYEDAKPDGVKEEDIDGEMVVDGAEEQWWCPGKKVCDRHAGWQTVRYKDVCKEKEKKEEALAKLTTRERELRKRIEDMLEPQNATNPTSNPTTKATIVKETTSNAPLKASNAKALNGHPKSKGATTTGDTLKKGKKRKAPAS